MAIRGARRSLSVVLLLFAVASAGLTSATLAAFGEETLWRDALLFARGSQGADSWRPMVIAFDYLQAGADTPLYDWLFFEQKVKFIYPPTALLVFEGLDAVAPRSAWGRLLALASWLLVLTNALLAALLLERGLRRAAPAPPGERAARIAVALALGLAFYPLLKAYTLGQMQVLVNALLAGLVLLWTTGHRPACGVLVALMAAVKPQYGVIVVWGALRGEWSFVAASAAAGGTILGASLLAFGWASHLNYLEVLAYVSRVGEAYYPNQTVNGLLNRLLQNGPILYWDPHVYPPYLWVVHAGTLVSSALLLAAGLLWRVRPPQRGRAVDLCAAVLAITMAAPIAWEHHYGVLLPVFAVLLPIALERPVFRRATLPLLAASYVLASNFLPLANRLAHTPANVAQSGLLAAALCVFAMLLCVLHAAGDGKPTVKPD